MNPQRILIINIFGIGDVLFTTPLLRCLREQIPTAFIGYVCNRRSLPILENNPNINKFFIYDRDEYATLHKESLGRVLIKAKADLQEIRDAQFDTVIDLSLNRIFNILSWYLGIPRRIGFNYKNRSPFLTHKVKIQGFEDRHVVEYILSLLTPLGFKVTNTKMEVFISPGDHQWAATMLRQQGISEKDCLVAVIPGGGVSWGPDASRRRWAPEKFSQIADKMIEKYHAKILVLGEPLEQDLAFAMQLAMRHPVINVTGQTSIGQYLALLSSCRLAVMNEGGPLHMAVAVGTPTVALVGSVDEKVYGPYPAVEHCWVVTKDLDCRPCYRNFHRVQCEHLSCIRTITVDEVWAKVETAFRESSKKY